MRAYYNEKVIDGLKYAMDAAIKRLDEQETVIEAKDAIIENMMVEMRSLKDRLKGYEEKRSIWNEVEE